MASLSSASTIVARSPGRRSLWRRAAGTVLRAEARHALAHEWRRTLAGEPALPRRPVRNVAVVCWGNLCRSPFAAALLAKRAPHLTVASFGLAAEEGDGADPRAIALAPRWGVELDAHRARRLGTQHVHEADLVLVMEAQHAAAIARRWSIARTQVRLLGDFLPTRPFAIRDPWDQEEAVWLDVYTRIDAATARLAARIGAAR